MNNILYDSQTIGKKYIEIVLENAQKVNLKDSIAIAEESLIKSEDKNIEKLNRKALQNYLLSNGMSDNKKFAEYIAMMAITGQQYKTYFKFQKIEEINVQYPQKRKCYKEVENYLNSNDQETKICAIYGIRRTGKSTLMEQLAQNLSDEKKKKALFITCEKETNFHDVVFFIEDSIKRGYKYFFIDEVTYAHDFQNMGNILSDVFVKMDNAKIIVTGTDSLGLSLISRDLMYDRIKFVPTTYTSFAEYSELTGIDDFDKYIKLGSTLKVDCYSSYDNMQEYVETSIVKNIINSLEKSEGIRTYPATLTELYDNNDLENAIQRIINKYSQNITIAALRKQFKIAPFDTALKTFDKTIYNYINPDYVNNTVKKILKIDELNTNPIKESHVEALSIFLEKLGLVSNIPVLSSYNTKTFTQDMKIINHPGMYHANIKYTLETLKDDKSWDANIDKDKKNDFIKKTYDIAMGIILENMIINDVYQLLSNGKRVDKDDIFGENTGRWYVSKLTYDDDEYNQYHEADLIIFDKEKKETYLFEIKHSKEVVEQQSKHLENERFNQYVKENFGPVKRTIVLYNGEIDTSLAVPRIPVTKFLKELSKQFNTKDFDMNKFINSLLSNSPCPKPAKKIDDDFGYGY